FTEDIDPLQGFELYQATLQGATSQLYISVSAGLLNGLDIAALGKIVYNYCYYIQLFFSIFCHDSVAKEGFSDIITHFLSRFKFSRQNYVAKRDILPRLSLAKSLLSCSGWPYRFYEVQAYI